MFKKNKKQTETIKEPKEKKVRTVKVGTHKKTVIALWVVLVASVSFGVYKNFTAIDQHTTHEKEIIELCLQDTNGIENFVKNFAKSYYTWDNSKEAIEARTQAISGYLTKELQDLNVDTIRTDIPTSSTVTDVIVWHIEQSGADTFSATYEVDQQIKEGEQTSNVLALKARTDYMFCAGFFHTRKNLKNFSKEVIKSHLAVLIWCGKRDKHFSNHKGKEVRLMKPSDFQKTVQCRFESCLKKVVRSVVKDYYKELNRRKNKEISFSELPDVLVDKMAVWDDYETDYTIFSVCGIDIRVLDDELAEALKKLPERKRNTLLMYYFLEMTESEIANLQKITQSGVFRNRHHALETMKKILKEEH